MNRIVKEYNSWLKENQKIILHLKSHESTLYTRIMPVYEVLNHLSNEYAENGLELNEDLLKIYQIGLEFLHSQIFTSKIYLEKTFNNDFHAFLKYDKIVGYLLYLDDLRYELVENKQKVNNKIFDKLSEYLENIMIQKQEIPDNINLYVDSEVYKVINKDINFHSIIDIFVEIADTLGMNLYRESDYIVGKDI